MDNDETKWWRKIKKYIMIPKILFTDPKYQDLSLGAKMMYGLVMDRTSLSASNGSRWRNKQGEVFVFFTQKEVEERLSCGHDKATKIMRELENAKLIRRVRQNRSRAYEIVVYPVVDSTAAQQSAAPKTSTDDCENPDANNTDGNNPNVSDPDTITCAMRMRMRMDTEDRIDYDALIDRLPQTYVDHIVDVIVDTMCQRCDSITVAKRCLSREEVVSRLCSLEARDVEYVYEHMQRQTTPILHLDKYILARLLDGPAAQDMYYSHWLSMDEKV